MHVVFLKLNAHVSDCQNARIRLQAVPNEALKSGNYKNAGYMFLDKFLSRVVNVSSEGDCAKNCANA
ncbi:MAG: hypothetical protein IJK52_13650, partial [Oscillospiraceae bacterium]|nr:hypothetical protein [Oscillospiraceae bacterium]